MEALLLDVVALVVLGSTVASQLWSAAESVEEVDCSGVVSYLATFPPPLHEDELAEDEVVVLHVRYEGGVVELAFLEVCKLLLLIRLLLLLLLLFVLLLMAIGFEIGVLLLLLMVVTPLMLGTTEGRAEEGGEDKAGDAERELSCRPTDNDDNPTLLLLLLLLSVLLLCCCCGCC